jgi:hypothetical protein
MFFAFSTSTANIARLQSRSDAPVTRHECRGDMLRRWSARAVRAVRLEEAQAACTTTEAMRRVRSAAV